MSAETPRPTEASTKTGSTSIRAGRCRRSAAIPDSCAGSRPRAEEPTEGLDLRAGKPEESIRPLIPTAAQDRETPGK